jgi:hypothetical protein
MAALLPIAMHLVRRDLGVVSFFAKLSDLHGGPYG